MIARAITRPITYGPTCPVQRGWGVSLLRWSGRRRSARRRWVVVYAPTRRDAQEQAVKREGQSWPFLQVLGARLERVEVRRVQK